MDERTKVTVKPVEYHELKAVAHIPLALFVMLSFPPDANLPAERLQSLRHYRELMEKAQTTLPWPPLYARATYARAADLWRLVRAAG